MKIKYLFIGLCIICIGFFFIHCQVSSSKKVNITTTTTLLGSIVEAIGQDRITVTAIVPAGMCPGHFDITSQSIKNLADSKILFNHGWEKWLDKLLAAVDNKPMLCTINQSGNVMVPPTHRKTAMHIATVLCSLDRANQTFYQNNLESYVAEIDSIIMIMEKQKARFAKTKVICSELQEEFVNWLGFDLIITFARAENLSPKILEQIIHISRQEQIAFVIDNMQSGTDAGKVIAQDIHAQHIVLTNFPLKGSYIDAVMDNFQKLVQAINEK